MGYYHWQWGCEIRTIQKVGNSHVVVIPASYLERLNLKKGDEVSMKLHLSIKAFFADKGKALIIEPMKED